MFNRKSDYFRPEIMFIYIQKLHRVKVKLTLCFSNYWKIPNLKEDNFLARIEQYSSLFLPAIKTFNQIIDLKR